MYKAEKKNEMRRKLISSTPPLAAYMDLEKEKK
jgi:hypothetical protein